jgi:hypothetical protein
VKNIKQLQKSFSPFRDLKNTIIGKFYIFIFCLEYYYRIDDRTFNSQVILSGDKFLIQVKKLDFNSLNNRKIIYGINLIANNILMEKNILYRKSLKLYTIRIYEI